MMLRGCCPDRSARAGRLSQPDNCPVKQTVAGGCLPAAGRRRAAQPSTATGICSSLDLAAEALFWNESISSKFK